MNNQIIKFNNPAFILYVVAMLLYIYCSEINPKYENLALYCLPIILASIGFLYFSLNRNHKKSILHYLIIFLLFLSDNVGLLQMTFFYKMSLAFYTIVLLMLLYLIIKDSKLINADSKIGKYLGVTFGLGIILVFFFKLISIFIIKHDFHSYYFVVSYIVTFLSVLVLSFYNLFKRRTKSSKYLVLYLLTVFLADFLDALDMYYFHNKILVFFVSIIQLPSYYFLVLYFANRDIESENELEVKKTNIT